MATSVLTEKQTAGQPQPQPVAQPSEARPCGIMMDPEAIQRFLETLGEKDASSTAS